MSCEEHGGLCVGYGHEDRFQHTIHPNCIGIDCDYRGGSTVSPGTCQVCGRITYDPVCYSSPTCKEAGGGEVL